MKRFLRSKLVLSLVAFLMIAAVVAVPLSGNFINAHAATPKPPSSLRDTWAWNYLSSAAQTLLLQNLGMSVNSSSSPSNTPLSTYHPLATPKALVTGNVPVNNIKIDAKSTQSETTIAIDPVSPGVVVVGYNDSISPNFTGYSFSLDGGASWTDAGAITSPSNGFDGGDPVLTVDKNGTFYFAQIATHRWHGSSQEYISMSTCSYYPAANRVECSLPQPVSRIVDGITQFNDKPGMTYDPVNNRVYVTWTAFHMDSMGKITGAIPQLRYFDVTTNTFSQVYSVSNSINGSGTAPVVTSTGLVYMFFEGFNNQNLNSPEAINYVTFNPAANHLSAVKVVGNTSISPAAGTITCGTKSEEAFSTEAFDTMHAARTLEFPSVAVDSSDDIYVVWNAAINSSSTPVSNIYFSILPNGSSSWTTPALVSSSNLIQWQPSVAISNNTVAVTYFQVIQLSDGSYQIERDQADAPTNTSPIFIAFPISTQSWAADQTNPYFAPNTNPVAPCYMGDYSTSVGSTTGPNVYSAWGDNRNNTPGIGPKPDVYLALVTVP